MGAAGPSIGGFESTLIGSISSEALQVLLAHWLEARRSRRLPARCDIDATRLGPVLANIWLHDYDPGAGTFRYRLAGEEVNRVFGGSVAGRLLPDVLSSDRLAPVNGNFLKIIGERVAMLASGPIYRCADRIAIGERLALPLAGDGETADGIIGATVWQSHADLDTVSMLEQQTLFVPVDDLGLPEQNVAAGELSI